MDKPWYIDVMTAVVVLAWMGWTFATMQQYGPSPKLLIPALIIGVVGILLIYGQRLTYLRFGEWFEMGMHRAEDAEVREDGGETEAGSESDDSEWGQYR